MFSQWATKRVYNFFMKRLLGRIVRSELDLEQLEVQLGFGTIRLKDLFLNTDYLNDQLGDAAVAIKEGSIGSIRAKIPWKVLTAESCEIEVDELKLVIVPRTRNEDDSDFQSHSASDELRFVDAPQYPAIDPEVSALGTGGGGAYMGVDDGVRMVAKMVERVLLGLRVKVTNMVIVFEEQLEKADGFLSGDGQRKESLSPRCLLIARIANLEYGVEAPHHNIGEFMKTASDTEPSMLVKVVKFKGATVEVVDVQDEIMSGLTRDEPHTGFVRQPTFILVGESGGLSGSIQLSVPWQEGTFNVPKVHADLVVGAIKLKLSPLHIRQLLSLTNAFIPEGAVGKGGSTGGTLVKSSMPNVGSLGNIAGSRSHNFMSMDSSEAQRMFSASLLGRSGRGLEADLSNIAFLPVSRFISDWTQWAGNEGQQKDVAVAEADLAASVDEFFECYDGSRSSQASFTSSGLWNWTRSAFSGITAASSLAGGSILFSKDPPKQPEYSMKARVDGISLDLYYECTSLENYSLVPTRASELYPVKDVSTVHAIVSETIVSEAHVLQDPTDSKAATEECLKAELSEISLCVTVSGWQTELSVTITDMDVMERVLKDAIEESQTSEGLNWPHQSQNSTSDIQLLQTSIMTALPSFPVIFSQESLIDTKRSTEKYEERQLLCVLSEPEYAAKVKLMWQSPSPVTGSVAGKAEITAFLQPLAIWLDVHTLRRMEIVMEKIKDSVAERKSSAGRDDNSISKLEQAHVLTGRKPEDASAKDTAEKGLVEVKVFAPCVRVITCFPAGVEPGSGGLLKDFVALDLSAPASKLGIAQPIVEFKHLGEKKTVLSSLPADMLLLRIGDITAHLVSSLDESLRAHNGFKGFAFSTDEILVISEDSTQGPLPTLDRHSEQGASVEFQWHDGTKIGSWIARRAWDGVMGQQSRGDGGRGIGGSNSEFAAATTAAEAAEVDNSQLRKELLSCSSTVVRVNIPHVKLRLSEPQYTRMLELIGSFIEALLFRAEETDIETLRLDPERIPPKMYTSQPCRTLQTAVLLQCGHVDIALHLDAQHGVPSNSKQGLQVWDVIRLNLKKLQVLSVLGIGGSANSSYLWVHHEDGEIMGSFLPDVLNVAYEEPELLLLSCKREALGRGDGGGGNALAAGKAGLTITNMVWPGQQKLADALLTGTMRGITVVAHGGRLDWLTAVINFFNSGDQMEDSLEMSVRSAVEISKRDSSGSPALLRTFFLLDLHDVAFCYEPGSEAILPLGVRPGRDALSSESSQIVGPVACVVAAAAVRVMSSVVPRVTGEEYSIWLRDVAIHLLDTVLRKKEAAFDYTTESMHSTGYAQIAKEEFMEALVRIDGDNGLQWEVECANNQLRFDTCHDTTAAFGRLAAQLQQLFAPEIEQPSSNANSWKADGRSSGVESMAGEIENCRNTDTTSINLFEGVVEDAFSRVRSSGSSAAGSVVDEFQVDTYTVISAPLQQDTLNRSKQVISGTVTKTVSSTPTQLQRSTSTLSVESVETSNTGLPEFIEDYYVTAQKHLSHPHGIIIPRQNGDSPRQSGGSSSNASRDSTSSGTGREAEGKGGWYTGKGLEVVEDHVDLRESVEKPSNQPENHSRKSSLPRKYPSSIGRLVLRDLSARWRFHGGSDWPVGNSGQDEKAPSQEECGRQSGACLEVLLDGVGLQYDTFPMIGLYASRLVVSIRDIGVYDCSSDAPWKMVLGYHRSKGRSRESSSQAVKIEMDSVRPDPVLPLEEYRLSVGLLPIRLHLDQRHIDFCIEFFSPRVSSAGGGRSPLVAGMPGNLELQPEGNDLAEDALLPYFQICEIRPFTVRVDYLPRRIDLMSIRAGNYAELLNLVTWKGIELNLKHVKAAGVHGWSSLSGAIFGEWMEDIAKSQVHKIIQGVGPIRPIYAVSSGAAKLVVLPAAYYKKDRRLFRGMRKGAVAFLRSLSLEALGLGTHLAAGAQEILHQTELALGGAPMPTSFILENGEKRSRAVQPGDTREGLQQACERISYGLERTASSLVGNPLKVYQRGAGAGLAVASALRAAPAAAMAPASAAAAAVHRALLGVRNELDPEKKRESDEKHRGPPPDTRRIR